MSSILCIVAAFKKDLALRVINQVAELSERGSEGGEEGAEEPRGGGCCHSAITFDTGCRPVLCHHLHFSKMWETRAQR